MRLEIRIQHDIDPCVAHKQRLPARPVGGERRCVRELELVHVGAFEGPRDQRVAQPWKMHKVGPDLMRRAVLDLGWAQPRGDVVEGFRVGVEAVLWPVRLMYYGQVITGNLHEEPSRLGGKH